MDFLSAMFKGIGDTFTAGASVDKAKLANENAAKDRDFAYASLYEQSKLGKLSYVINDAALEQKIVTATLISVVLLIGIIIFLRFRKNG